MRAPMELASARHPSGVFWRSARCPVRRWPVSCASAAPRAPTLGGRVRSRARRRVAWPWLRRCFEVAAGSDHRLDAARRRAHSTIAPTVFSFPSGRLASTLGRGAVGLVYATWPWGESEAATIAFAVLLLAVPLAQLRGVVGVERRGRTPAAWAAAGISLVLAAGAAARLAFPEGDADDPALLAYEAVICAAAVGLAAALVRARWLSPPGGGSRRRARRDACHHGARRARTRARGSEPRGRLSRRRRLGRSGG